MVQHIEIQFFGPITSFVFLKDVSHIEIEQWENFQKMSYRNRMQVLGPDKVHNLTVPVVGGRNQKRLTWEVEIDYSTPWVNDHWRTLESLYNRSPFFLHYAPGLKTLYNSKPKYLWQLALESLNWTLDQIKWKRELGFSKEWLPQEQNTDSMDLRGKFLPKNRHQFLIEPYQQVFGNRFENNLSILDLLFNLGPETAAYLSRQVRFKPI